MIQFQRDYLPALLGLPLGLVAGLILTALVRGRELAAWDARVTLPLLLGAAAAHLALLTSVEQPRAIFFVLYALSIFATVASGLVGVALWRLAAVALPAASILAYGYFAAVAHEADVIGLLVKVAELAAIAAALIPVLRPRPGRGRLTVS